MFIDFSRRLNWRGTDFMVYANTGYAANTEDSKMLSNIISSVLLTHDNGVSSIGVQAFKLRIEANSTTDVDYLMNQVEYAVACAGYSVEVLERKG